MDVVCGGWNACDASGQVTCYHVDIAELRQRPGPSVHFDGKRIVEDTSASCTSCGNANVTLRIKPLVEQIILNSTFNAESIPQ